MWIRVHIGFMYLGTYFSNKGFETKLERSPQTAPVSKRKREITVAASHFT